MVAGTTPLLPPLLPESRRHRHRRMVSGTHAEGERGENGTVEKGEGQFLGEVNLAHVTQFHQLAAKCVMLVLPYIAIAMLAKLLLLLFAFS